MSRTARGVFSATVTSVQQLSPTFFRVSFASPELRNLAPGGPDQRIKLFFPQAGRSAEVPDVEDWYSVWRLLPNDERSAMRTYTIRASDPAAGELVVDFAAHGDAGPASRWITRATPGDELLVAGLDARAGAVTAGYEWHPGAATTLLIAGDETAVPAVARILESLPTDARGAVFLEIPTAADALPLEHPAGMQLSWLPRDAGTGSDHGLLLGSAVREFADAWVGERATQVAGDDALINPDTEVLWEVPPGPEDAGLYAWLAGEATAITQLRRHLVRELGIDRSRVAFMGYWKLGRAEN